MFGRETFIVRIVERVVDADNDIQGVVVPVGHKVRAPPSAGGEKKRAGQFAGSGTGPPRTPDAETGAVHAWSA